jgi:magnesium-transporting ATPase (P-type)
MEPAEGDELARTPRSRKEPLVNGFMLGRLLLMAATITAVTLTFYIVRPWFGGGEAQARTATFTLLAVCEWFNVLNCRSATRSALSFDLIKNRALLIGIVLSSVLQAAVVYVPALQRVFHTVALPLSEVLLVGAVGSLVLWVEETRKWLWNRRAPALLPPV